MKIRYSVITIDIVVGQGSSVISFTVQNTGSGYGNLEKLTVPIGGTTGIPTDPSKTFTEMLIDIDKKIPQSKL